jgi:hypothetical protein
MRCVPVWQKVQVSVQPTWLETQSVPRPLPGCRRSPPRPGAPPARREAEQPFSRAVLRHLLGDDLWTFEREFFRERFAQRLRDVRHCGKSVTPRK